MLTMSCLKKRKLPVKPWRVKEAEGRFFEGGILVEAHDILYSGKIWWGIKFGGWQSGLKPPN